VVLDHIRDSARLAGDEDDNGGNSGSNLGKIPDRSGPRSPRRLGLWQSWCGKKPALLVIDVSYGFTGDKPEPILDSIKQWRNSCGAESWTAVAVIRDLAELFRTKKLPVIYSTGFLRGDNWDAGGWAWKNNRTSESAPVKSANRDANEIVSELAPQPQDIIVYKQKPSVFFGSNLRCV
jgi:maleamate amidohydrolase